jgi:membrane associated rhomboid family serine protease
MIGLCAIVFVFQASEKPGAEKLVEQYGMIPFRVTHPEETFEIKDLQIEEDYKGRQREVIVNRPGLPAGVTPIFTLFTCIFLHGGFMHFAGNMLFLYIFGDNVEDCFGHLGYLCLYLVGGVMASLSHLLTDPSSTIPTIGASGAIAAVMGGYFVLYPNAMVMTIIPLGGFMRMQMVPALLFLGLWFVIQIASGIGTQAGGGGVAWWAHIGGFVFGFIGAWILKATHHLRPLVQERVAPSQRLQSYRMKRGW